MASTQNIKVAVLGAFTVLFFIWLAAGTLSKAFGSSDIIQTDLLSVAPTPNPDEYVGTETCAA